MYINLHSLVPYICGVSCGFININNYNVYIDCNENEFYDNPSFLALPYIKAPLYRELKNDFLEKYFPRKSKFFKNLDNNSFEDYFHLTVNDNLLLDDWYKYEDEYKIKLLQEWCEKNNIYYTLKNESYTPIT